MKKISVLSVFAVLTIPAFAGTENVNELYGNEPVPEEVVAQYEKQFKKTDAKQAEKTQKIENNQDVETVKKEAQEVKKIETVKKIKKVQKTEEIEEIQEPKYEAPSNPKARFPHGLQFGVGVSPTSGLNGFVGYNSYSCGSSSP